MRTRDTIRLAVLLLCCAAAPGLQAQAQATQDETNNAHLLDSVVAVVNNDVLLESDVEEEERFAAFQPFTAALRGGNPRQEALRRLIDRTLVEQQMRRQAAEQAVTLAQVDTELAQLRKSLPECAKYACTTDAGWKNFCQAQGFTPEQVEQRWQERMLLLKFIEQRFKTGIRISEREIQEYYDQKFVPRFRERNATPPPLPQISDRIEEILLQQRVNVLLEDWLRSLHDQGSVQILDPSLIPPASSIAPAPAANLPPAGGAKSIDGVTIE